MRHIDISVCGQRRLPFFLAVEEWVARSLPADEYFFAWRVSPTVICGRNQDMAAEVDLEYCRQHNIDVVRRRSGGGCVYADMDNWMMSYIAPSHDVCTSFSRYTTMVADMLRCIGFDARSTGRNDIFIGDRKVSGNAFYHLPDRAIVHGTMLCRIDREAMSHALTPSAAKLRSKGVRSVEAHVTSLTEEGLSMPISDFGAFAVEHLCSGAPVIVGPEDIRSIEEIERRYYSPEFLDGKFGGTCHRHGQHSRRCRIDGVGDFEVTLIIDGNNLIQATDISGDFFVVGDVGAISAALVGREYNAAAIRSALDGVDASSVIAGLDNDALYSIFEF